MAPRPNRVEELPTPTKMSAYDEDQLNLLATLSFIFGLLCILCHSIFLLHVYLGVTLAMGTGPLADPTGGLPRETAWLWIAGGSIAVLVGWAMAILNFMAIVRLRKKTGYTFLTVVSAINCVNMPLGMALGVFTLIVINREDVKRALQAK